MRGWRPLAIEENDSSGLRGRQVQLLLAEPRSRLVAQRRGGTCSKARRFASDSVLKSKSGHDPKRTFWSQALLSIPLICRVSLATACFHWTLGEQRIG